MKIAKTTVLKLTPDEVKEAILKLYKPQDRDLDVTVRFDVATETHGYGMSEYDEVVFRGADVTLKEK